MVFQPRKTAALITALCASTGTLTLLAAMMPSSHAVSMVFSLNSSVSSSSPRYSTVVRISPRMKSSLRALTSARRAWLGLGLGLGSGLGLGLGLGFGLGFGFGSGWG